MSEDFLDHYRIFDARDDLDGTTTVLAGQDVDLEHALQPLRPRQNNCWAMARRVIEGLAHVDTRTDLPLSVKHFRSDDWA